MAFKDAFRVEDTQGDRWELALDLLRKGEAIEFHDVRISVHDGRLVVEGASSWQFRNVTEATARSDLASSQAVIDTLMRESEEFAAIAHRHRPDFVLVDDPGMGPVLIARMRDGEIEWAPGFPVRAGGGAPFVQDGPSRMPRVERPSSLRPLAAWVLWLRAVSAQSIEDGRKLWASRSGRSNA